MKVISVIFTCFILSCSVTSHPVKILSFNNSVDLDQAVKPSRVKLGFKKIKAATWKISLSGLLNLDDPKALKAGIKERLEDIELYFYVIDHPKMGRFLVDTGVSEDIAKDTSRSPIPWLMKSMMGFEHLKTTISTKEFVQSSAPIKGVFLTHMHADHIMGMLDLPKNIRIIVGPDEAQYTHMKNFGVQGVVDDLFEGHQDIEQLQFPQVQKGLASIDFFGDGSFIVLSTPGHTPGSLSFIANGQNGVHLIVGDTSHTAWGWNNSVTPGDFTLDHRSNQESLDQLIQLGITHKLKVHLGHQEL